MATMANTSGVATDKHTVGGVFDGPRHAEQALNGLKGAGFTPEQVSVVAQDKHDVRQLAEHTDMAGQGAAAGAVSGGLRGGVAGFVLGISALVIPGIGPIVGAGSLVSTLAGGRDRRSRRRPDRRVDRPRGARGGRQGLSGERACGQHPADGPRPE